MAGSSASFSSSDVSTSSDVPTSFVWLTPTKFAATCAATFKDMSQPSEICFEISNAVCNERRRLGARRHLENDVSETNPRPRHVIADALAEATQANALMDSASALRIQNNDDADLGIGSLEVPQYDVDLPIMPSPNFDPGSSMGGKTWLEICVTNSRWWAEVAEKELIRVTPTRR